MISKQTLKLAIHALEVYNRENYGSAGHLAQLGLVPMARNDVVNFHNHSVAINELKQALDDQNRQPKPDKKGRQP